MGISCDEFKLGPTYDTIAIPFPMVVAYHPRSTATFPDPNADMVRRDVSRPKGRHSSFSEKAAVSEDVSSFRTVEGELTTNLPGSSCWRLSTSSVLLSPASDGQVILHDMLIWRMPPSSSSSG
ncbi:hypothetical protein VKT23_014015 [Stygiomarasmius scandens]|uniref:Uncharacterized protein n=1 Tax=Marasmiellus scandens TaxID=2682957 RepID=A0ABR1J6R7_9AGAR